MQNKKIENNEKNGICPKCGFLNIAFRPKVNPQNNEILWMCNNPKECNYVFRINKLSSLIDTILKEE